MISHIYIEYINKTKTALTHISSNQLLFIINACHCDLTHTARGKSYGLVVMSVISVKYT